MTTSKVERVTEYSPDIYWERTADSYSHYPTVRHRRRFILRCLRKVVRSRPDIFLFDYGCGEGDVLAGARNEFKLKDCQLGGCDISRKAIEIAQTKVRSPYLYSDGFSTIPRPCDVVICSEVIEHTGDYPKILRWAWDNLVTGGLLILTTQSGKIHASDLYTGHVKHFRLAEILSILTSTGFRIERARLWGFPLFSLQKYMTDVNFKVVREHYLEGAPSVARRLLFSLAYLLYFLHDAVAFGPQIYIVASKQDREK